MTDEEIFSLIKEAFSAMLPERASEIEHMTLDSKVLDLAIDSIGVIGIVGYVEDRLGRTFEPDEVLQVKTIGDVSAMIRLVLSKAK